MGTNYTLQIPCLTLSLYSGGQGDGKEASKLRKKVSKKKYLVLNSRSAVTCRSSCIPAGGRAEYQADVQD